MTKVTKNLAIWLTVVTALLSACKKSSNGTASPNYDDSTQFTQKVFIKIVATQPSPWDSANNPLADSVIINQLVKKGEDATGVYLNIGAVNFDNLAYDIN